MPKFSKKSQATIKAIAAKNGIATEDVLNHLENLFRGNRVSKHRSILTGTTK